jgi:integrase
MEAFVASRRAADSLSDRYEESLHQFDAFCAAAFPAADGLTQEMVDRWCEPRPTELANSCRSRCSIAVALVRFLRERGETDVVPPELPRRRETGYVPHPFSDDELSEFFRLCDGWEPRGRNMPECRRLRSIYTVPVLFRLLWSSGIRTTEARLLRRERVDLVEGTLTIVEGKGKSERTVALHPSMLEIMREYDSRMEEVMPGRTYFFPNGAGTCLERHWVTERFHEVWGKVSDEPATPYQLRHCFCVTCINRLVGRGLEGLNDLEWVSKAMGHSSVDVTIQSYYHIVPALAELLQERSGDRFDDMMPGVM